MKYKLIDQYYDLRGFLLSLSKQEWACGGSIDVEMRMRRIDGILKARYGYDVSLSSY